MPVPDYLAGMKAETKKLRLGFARVPYYDDLSPEFLAATDAAFAVLKDLTATSRDINLPAVEGLASITDVETLAYHSQWYPKYKTAYPARWIPYFETTAKIPAADYAKALADIQRLRREIGKVFENVDVVVTPARRSYTGKLEDVLKAQASPDATAEAGFNYTAPFSVFGLPAMNVPCGFTKAGLPVAIQIIGRH